MADPQSRAEAIVQATIDGEEYQGLPQSRLEKLLIDLNKGGGGGGGTKNYEDLENLPTINGNVAKGELSDDILELVEPFDSQDETDLLDIIEDDPNTAGHQEDDFVDDEF